MGPARRGCARAARWRLAYPGSGNMMERNAVITAPAATTSEMDQLCINTMRTLSMDAVQAANSGHPGAPMALAPVAYCLWQRFLRYDPADPIWPNRDRFVLSAGHASLLLYSLLHLTVVQAVSKEDEEIRESPVHTAGVKRLRPH